MPRGPRRLDCAGCLDPSPPCSRSPSSLRSPSPEPPRRRLSRGRRRSTRPAARTPPRPWSATGADLAGSLRSPSSARSRRRPPSSRPSPPRMRPRSRTAPPTRRSARSRGSGSPRWSARAATSSGARRRCGGSGSSRAGRSSAPFDDEGKRGLETAYPPEERVDLAATYAGKGSEVSWRPLPEEAVVHGFVDLGAAIRPAREVVAYAVALVEAPRDERVALWLGASGAAKVWVNGAVAISDPGYHPARLDQRGAMVTLRRGTNRILVKVCHQGGRMGFFLRLADERGDGRAYAAGSPAAPTPEPGARPVADRGRGGAARARVARASKGRAQEAEARRELAVALAERQSADFEERRPAREARRAAELTPRSVEAQLRAASLEEDHARRRSHVEAALAAAPGNPRALAALAREELDQGRPHAALRLLDRAVAAAPRWAAPRVDRVEALDRAGLEVRAVRAAAEVADAFPTTPGAVRAAARAAARLSRVDEAVARFRTLLALRLDDAEARGTLAHLLVERGDVAGAAALLDGRDPARSRRRRAAPAPRRSPRRERPHRGGRGRVRVGAAHRARRRRRPRAAGEGAARRRAREGRPRGPPGRARPPPAVPRAEGARAEPRAGPRAVRGTLRPRRARARRRGARAPGRRRRDRARRAQGVARLPVRALRDLQPARREGGERSRRGGVPPPRHRLDAGPAGRAGGARPDREARRDDGRDARRVGAQRERALVPALLRHSHPHAVVPGAREGRRAGDRLAHRGHRRREPALRLLRRRDVPRRRDPKGARRLRAPRARGAAHLLERAGRGAPRHAQAPGRARRAPLRRAGPGTHPARARHAGLERDRPLRPRIHLRRLGPGGAVLLGAREGSAAAHGRGPRDRRAHRRGRARRGRRRGAGDGRGGAGWGSGPSSRRRRAAGRSSRSARSFAASTTSSSRRPATSASSSGSTATSRTGWTRCSRAASATARTRRASCTRSSAPPGSTRASCSCACAASAGCPRRPRRSRSSTTPSSTCPTSTSGSTAPPPTPARATSRARTAARPCSW